MDRAPCLSTVTSIGCALTLCASSPSASAQTEMWTADGAAPFPCGFRVASAGDVDADGFDDLIVGDPCHPVFDQGRVPVLSGLDGAVIFDFVGGAVAAIGEDVSGAGDIDADGHADFLYAGDAAEHVWLRSGATGGQIAALTIGGGGPWSVAPAGDANADGFDDFLVGAPTSDAGGLDEAGEVHLLSGRFFAEGVAPEALHIFEGEMANGHFGFDVDGAGDIDGDGYDDVLIGAPDQSSFLSRGRIFAYSGQDGELLFTRSGPFLPAAFGSAVSSAGDVNADGFGDVLVGAPGVDAAGGPGKAFVYAGPDGALLWQWTGPVAGDSFGAAVDGGEDVDGDQHPDLLIGIPDLPDGGAQLYSGRTGNLIHDFATLAQNATLGDSVALAGNFDGIGSADLALSDGSFANPVGYGRAYVFSGLCSGWVESYCITTPNSVGPGVTLSWSGTTSIAANDFTLHAAGGVPAQFGLFYYGPQQVQFPWGDGVRCVGSADIGLFRLNPPLPIQPDGSLSRTLDFTAPPMSAGPGRVLPGSKWNLQFWYRDPMGGPAGFNYSDALSAIFCP